MDVKESNGTHAQQRLVYQNHLREIEDGHAHETEKLRHDLDLRLKREQARMSDERKREVENLKNSYENRLREQAYHFDKLKTTMREDHQKEVENMRRIFDESMKKQQEQTESLVRRQQDLGDEKAERAVRTEQNKINQLVDQKLKETSESFAKDLEHEKTVFQIQKENLAAKKNQEVKRAQYLAEKEISRREVDS